MICGGMWMINSILAVPLYNCLIDNVTCFSISLEGRSALSLSNGSALIFRVVTWYRCGSVFPYFELRFYVDLVVSVHSCRFFIADVLLTVHREFVACQNSRGILSLSIEVRQPDFGRWSLITMTASYLIAGNQIYKNLSVDIMRPGLVGRRRKASQQVPPLTR